MPKSRAKKTTTATDSSEPITTDHVDAKKLAELVVNHHNILAHNVKVGLLHLPPTAEGN